MEPRSTSEVTATRLLLRASSDAQTAASTASVATVSTTVGPSVTRSASTNSTHPSAAPARSAEYNRLTCGGNLVSARHTAIPLNTNGTEISAYVPANPSGLA